MDAIKTIPLTPDPGSRANCKPKPRYGVVVESPWVMPYHVLVEVKGEVWPDGSQKVAWVPKKFLEGGE